MVYLVLQPEAGLCKPSLILVTYLFFSASTKNYINESELVEM